MIAEEVLTDGDAMHRYRENVGRTQGAPPLAIPNRVINAMSTNTPPSYMKVTELGPPLHELLGQQVYLEASDVVRCHSSLEAGLL